MNSVLFAAAQSSSGVKLGVGAAAVFVMRGPVVEGSAEMASEAATAAAALVESGCEVLPDADFWRFLPPTAPPTAAPTTTRMMNMATRMNVRHFMPKTIAGVRFSRGSWWGFSRLYDCWSW